MDILNILLIIVAFLFFYSLWLTLTEMMPPSTALKKKGRHRTLLPHANGKERIGPLARTISVLGGYRLALFHDGWYVFSEPLNLFSYGYFHLIRLSDAGIEVKTVCRQIGGLGDRKIHARFLETVTSMMALDSDNS